MQVCEHRLQRHLMVCIMRQEDESVASSRLRMRVGAILVRHITRAFGEAIFASFRSVNLCFVLTIIISLASLLLLLWFLSFLFFFVVIFLTVFTPLFFCFLQLHTEVTLTELGHVLFSSINVVIT